MKPNSVFFTVLFAVCAAAPLFALEPTPPSPVDKPQPSREQIMETMKGLEKELEIEQNYVREFQARLRDLTQRADVSAESLQKAASHLDDELGALELDLICTEVRMKELADRIGALKVTANDVASKDAICLEYRKILELKKKIAAFGPRDKTEELSESITVAEIMAKLAAREREVSESEGGEMAAVWKRELMNLTIDKNQKQVRQNLLKNRLVRYTKALQLLPQAQFHEEAMKMAMKQLLDYREELGRHTKSL